MDFVIHRFGGYEFSPYDRNQSTFISQHSYLTSVYRAPLNVPEIPWLNDVSEFAQSGSPQAVVLILSLSWITVRLVQLRREIFVHRLKASKIHWPFELLSQVARLASVSFLSIAYVEGRAHLLNVIVPAYAFFLGLLRLVNDLQWRHVALHQVNFVFTAMLLLLVTAHSLPCIQIGSQCMRDASLIGAISVLTLTFVLAIMTPREWVPPKIDMDIPGCSPGDEPSPEESCSWLTYYCTYEWLTPTIWKGTKGKLEMDGIPKIAWYDEPMYLLRQVQKARSISKKTLLTAVRFQRDELILMAIWIGAAYTVENLAPYGMFKLLEYLANPSDATYRPWLWLLLMFIGPLTRSICFQQYVFNSTRLVVRIKSAFTQELYHTALDSMELEEDPFELHSNTKSESTEKRAAPKSTSAGRLSNLMASDVDAIYRARDMILALVGVPLGTIISLIGMYRMLGWASLVGTAILALATPVSIWLGRSMYFSQRRVRKAQDSRMSLVTEYLASLRAIKYFSWETPITEKIIEARAAEQKELWRVSVLQAVLNQITQIFPYLSLLVMFALHVGLDKHRLDAATAFTSIFLVKNIRRNIMQASSFARNFAGALVSVSRLDKYFESTVPLLHYPVGPLQIKEASFRRNKKASFTLNDISLDFAQGGLNAISGPSGSGKSTLLLAILGETYIEGGSVTRPKDVAFASQSAWLQNDTIQGNILFGSPMEKVRYERVIEACCLWEDFKELPERDFTTVGENGTSLSGGQKARVALARALYSKAPLLLLDDILAALDAKTAAGVWKHCFCSDLLNGRTTVLVTNIPWISEQVDFSVTLEKGLVKLAETQIGVVRKPIALAQVLGGDIEDTGTPDGVESGLQSDNTTLNESVEAEEKPAKDIVNQEMKDSGKVGRLTSLQYMSYFGHPAFVIICLSFLLATHIFTFAGTLWLSVWVEAYNHKAHVDIAYYMGIFAALTFLDIAFYSVPVIMFEWGAWRAARRLHNDFIRAIMGVSLSWFKHIPIGRITNRFSSDMASIDGMLSSMLRATLDAILMMLFRLGAVSSIMPIFMVPALFTCLFGVLIGEMYTRTAVVIKRLTSSAQSPVFSQFADTLSGLSVIRARAGMPEAFREELANKLRAWSTAAEANFNANRWVAVRVDFVTALVALSAGIIAVSQAGVVAAGLVGFSLTNANGLSQTILMLVRCMNDLEVEMQSFHRVKEYVKLEPEEKGDETYSEEDEYTDDPSHVIPKGWPLSGDIEFRNVTIRYDPEGPDILTDVNLKFRAGERVAIVGRTGSGKSTLVLSLLRFTHVVSGQILYDGVDITKVPRHRLREALTIIPQEAVLFNGTVRSNLDPGGQLPQAILDKALDNCKGIASFSVHNSDDEDDHHDDATDDVHNNPISLDTNVDARGENFSHGQRQVLSLCRALIRQSKLMLLDEATASMDYETDQGIQKVLRRELDEAGGDRTLVTIAHRLRTIIDYDTVVVMSAGRVLECGSPKDLYHTRGQFYDMVYHSGEMEDLQAILDE
ncbi:P-loop containing nucleoside triphosphate hydrolase protein [Dactylonectria macrodidyma]|uniref:P-loop containing nucleoside triphosphate hydrolase protein n=1 Tax=Dactylonectria macrodidyma TaxID=307937 RepID=A0A9P9FNE0_9HYPO|nr:P-loop containing nucleoside triphosphate hydrolase protein [Dactylonectria macrodidyma]